MQNSGSLDKISRSSISMGVAKFELRAPIFCKKVFFRFSASWTNVCTIEAVSLFSSATVNSSILSSYCFKALVTMPSFFRTRAKFLFTIWKFSLLFELWESKREILTFLDVKTLWWLDVWVVVRWRVLIAYVLCTERFVKVKIWILFRFYWCGSLLQELLVHAINSGLYFSLAMHAWFLSHVWQLERSKFAANSVRYNPARVLLINYED